MGLTTFQQLCMLGHVIALLACIGLIISPNWVHVETDNDGDDNLLRLLPWYRLFGPSNDRPEKKARVGPLTFCVEFEDHGDEECRVLRWNDFDSSLPLWLSMSRALLAAAIYLLLITVLVDIYACCRPFVSTSLCQGLLTVHSAVCIILVDVFFHSHYNDLGRVVLPDMRGETEIETELCWTTTLASVTCAFMLLIGIVSMFLGRESAPKQIVQYVLPKKCVPIATAPPSYEYGAIG